MMNGSTFVHVFGDTHGDYNYLVRCLLSTGYFALRDKELIWRPDLPHSQWEVVIAGDQINKGVHSFENLLLIKRLSEDEIWGSRLVFVMGNHEGVFLELGNHFAGDPKKQADLWTAEKRWSDYSATNGSGEEIITWMTERPPLYIAGKWSSNNSVLIAHGGLSETLL